MKINIVRVISKGDLENERIVLKVNEGCDLGDYILFDTTYEDDDVSNTYRHSFFWSKFDVKANDFIVVYTKSGKRKLNESIRGDTYHFFYWGFDHTIWNQEKDRALLCYSPQRDSKDV